MGKIFIMEFTQAKTRLGARIKQLRKHKNLTQEELASPFNSEKSFICDIEKGRKNVTLQTLCTIAQKLEVELHDLFIWE